MYIKCQESSESIISCPDTAFSFSSFLCVGGVSGHETIHSKNMWLIKTMMDCAISIFSVLCTVI